MSDTHNYLKRGVDYPVTEGARTLPGKYYHDEGIYGEELNKIFYKFWILACRAEEIPGTGDFKIFEVGDESIILTRDKSNQINALFNVCRHRGTQLCAESKGNFPAKCIRCPYHSWTYELNGNLQGAPSMKNEKSFDKSNFSLHRAHVHEWQGFVFISLAEQPEPFEVQMEALSGKFTEWKMADLRIAHHIKYELKCNWKLIIQNYQECYHCLPVHPLLSQFTPTDSARHDFSKGAVIGGYMKLSREGGSMTMDGDAAAPPVGDVSGDNLQRIYYYSVFPNMLLSPHPDFVLFHHISPLGTGKITNDCYWLFDPDVIDDSSAQKRIKSAVDFWDLTNKQDWTVCEQMQSGTGSIRFTRGHYSGHEDILLAIDNEYLKIMGHTLT